jgi:predicted transglutaminase-like cysteine proteinase
MRILWIVLTALCTIGLEACQTLPLPPISQAMAPGAKTPAPFGFVDFCQRHEADCQSQSTSNIPARLTATAWYELQNVNWQVNTETNPITDSDHYQTIEYWAYPNGSGDCEDYALAKRKKLIELGWPAHSLLLSVAIEEKGTAHAVLVVVTDKGDFVLDNQALDILPWQYTPYTWDKRQSVDNPMIWVKLQNRQQIASLSSASIKP